MGMSRWAGVVPAGAVSVALVLGGLSAAPSAPANQLAGGGQVATVQLESIVLSAFDAAIASPVVDLASARSIVTEPVSAAAATGSSDLLRTVLSVGIGLAVAPLWYVGLPVTLPLSIGLGMYAMYAIDKIFLPSNSEAMHLLTAAVAGSVVGALGWVAGPLAVGSIAANSLMPAEAEPAPLAEAAAVVPSAAGEPAAARVVRESAPEPTSVRAQRASRGASAARGAATEMSTDATNTDHQAQPAQLEAAYRKGSAKNRDGRQAPARSADTASRR